MSEPATEVFFQFPENAIDNISYGFQHPDNLKFRDELKRKAQTKGFEVLSLREIVTLREESITPTKTPNDFFDYLGLGDMESGTGKIFGYERLLGSQILSKSSVFRKGDIVFGRLRPYLNKVYLVKDREMSIGSGELYVITPKPDLVYPDYLLHFLISELTLIQTKRILSGNSYPRLNKDQFLNLLIIRPKKEEQERIMTERVYPTEEKIHPLEQEIEKQSKYADSIISEELRIDQESEGIPKEYFFKTGEHENSVCFPVSSDEVVDRLSFNYHDPKLSILSKLIAKYSTTTLGNAVTIRRGEQPEYDENGDVIVIKTIDLKNGFINYEECLKVSRKFFESVPTAHVKRGDVLVSSTGYVSMGKVDVFDSDKDAVADGHISIFQSKQGYDLLFIAYYLRSHLGKIQFERWWSGSSGQIELQIEDFMKFIIPDNSERGIPLSKQQIISERISMIENHIAGLKEERKRVSEIAEKEFLGQIGFLGMNR